MWTHLVVLSWTVLLSVVTVEAATPSYTFQTTPEHYGSCALRSIYRSL